MDSSCSASSRLLSHADLLRLKRWNTPTIYNGWEQITQKDPARDGFNLEETRDYMPQMGPMIGYAVTLVIEPGNREHKGRLPNAWADYRKYIASIPGPKIAVVQDLDKPTVFGSFWGEVNSNTHHALGCVGTITDGAIRDLDEMTNAGFKALARRLCVGHAHAWPVRWGEPVKVFGRTVESGALIHADKHGFLVIPSQDQHNLLEAVAFMDQNECQTVIQAARSCAGKGAVQVLEQMNQAAAAFRKATSAHFQRSGEF